MSVRRMGLICVLLATGTGTAWLLSSNRRAFTRRTWNTDAVRATFEMVVPAHNDASFRYALENRTDSDYRIADKSDVQFVQTTRSGAQSIAQRVSGEFPLWVPAKRTVHFALVWTADRDIDPERLSEFLGTLNVRSFVLFDKVHGYQIEFPAGR